MLNTCRKSLKALFNNVSTKNKSELHGPTCYQFLWWGQKKNCYVALTRPKFENWVGRSIFFYFFYFFLRTVRELSFPIFFLKFLNGENSGGMQSKRIYKCFFRPLNTNFSKFFAQIWHFQQKTKNKKTRPCFFAFYGRSGEGNITIFFLA